MKGLSIFWKLALGYLAMVSIVFVIGIFGISELTQLNQITRSITSVDSRIIKIGSRLRSAILSLRGFEGKYIISKDKEFYLQFLETDEYIRADIEQLSLISSKAKIEGVIAELSELHGVYLEIVQEEMLLIELDAGYPQGQYQKVKEDIVNKMSLNLNKAILLANSDMDRKIEMSGEISSIASRTLLFMTVAAITIAILIVFFNARTVSRPIHLLIAETKDIAKGSFENHLTITSPSEIAQLADAFNQMCSQLKELDDLKANLISNISHQLRTPLSVIREAVSLLSDGISTGSEEKQRKFLAMIGEESERLIVAVNRILDISRMDAGMIEYRAEKYGLFVLVNKAVSKIRPIAESKGVRLEVGDDKDLPSANVDPGRISQVLDSLLENALKFTPKNGKISISTSLDRTGKTGGSSGKDKGMIVVSVSDNGRGIPKGKEEEIFKKFKKLQDGGTGLGLYIAKHIVGAYRGKIWVKSEPGKGSTFSFTVPVY